MVVVPTMDDGDVGTKVGMGTLVGTTSPVGLMVTDAPVG